MSASVGCGGLTTAGPRSGFGAIYPFATCRPKVGVFTQNGRNITNVSLGPVAAGSAARGDWLAGLWRASKKSNRQPEGAAARHPEPRGGARSGCCSGRRARALVPLIAKKPYLMLPVLNLVLPPRACTPDPGDRLGIDFSRMRTPQEVAVGFRRIFAAISRGEISPAEAVRLARSSRKPLRAMRRELRRDIARLKASFAAALSPQSRRRNAGGPSTGSGAAVRIHPRTAPGRAKVMRSRSAAQ